ncbi:hypothetical protein BJ508DRAFT_64038 [Ascobolus immersus RN42]|uniref:Uncharacterized protein n=1 Tax=Ascobolus immersus RN42 TaxID=1160509 RepID=A0A3N4IU70_ASCIM|nr:hypothetical protein BJ508DRAFT_64038 [Ascobolus immersus RN42]
MGRNFSPACSRALSLRSCLLLCLLPVTAVLSEALRDEDYLQPIRWEDYQAAYTGVRKRNVDTSAYMLRDEAQFIYGKPNGGDVAVLANLHIQSTESRKMLVLEDLDPLLKFITCTDGRINIHFKSSATAREAYKHWAEAILDDDTSVIAVTDHKGCGLDQNQRHPFLIYDVFENDKSQSTIALRSKNLEWSDVIGDASIEFGRQQLAKPKLFLSRRDDKIEDEKDLGLGGFFDDEDSPKWFEDLKDVVTPDFLDYEDKENRIESQWDLDSGSPGVRMSLLPLSDPTLTSMVNIPSIPGIELACTNCYTRGTLGLSGYLRTENWNLTELRLEVEVLDKLEAVVETNVVAEGKLASIVLPQLPLFDSSMVTGPVSFGGIRIKGLFEVGPALQIGLGMDIKIESNINITTGVATSVEKGAKVVIDLINYDKSSVTGWDFKWDPKFSADGLEMAFTVDNYVETSLNFGVKIAGGKTGKVRLKELKIQSQELVAALKLRAPNLSTVFSIGYDDEGFCEGKDSKTGVSAAPSVSAAFGFEILHHLAGDMKGRVIYEHEFFKKEEKLKDICLPFEFSTVKTLELKAKAEIEKVKAKVEDVVTDVKDNAEEALSKLSAGDRLVRAGTSLYVLAGTAVAVFFSLL